jgi:hypothetical protein
MSKRLLPPNAFLIVPVILWCCGGAGLVVAEPQPEERLWTYDAKGKRDPFIRLVRDGRIVTVTGATSESSAPTLLGILWDPSGRSLALINDTEVKVGDTVGDYQVSEIRQDAVVLTRDGERITLQITFEEPLNPPGGLESRGGERP